MLLPFFGAAFVLLSRGTVPLRFRPFLAAEFLLTSLLGIVALTTCVVAPLVVLWYVGYSGAPGGQLLSRERGSFASRS